MLHKAWNSKGEMPYCFARSSSKFQGHTGQNITDFDPNWAFPDYRPVAAFKSLRFALLWWWRHRWRHRVASNFSLYSCLGEIDSGSKLQGQCLVNKCQYHNWLSRVYMPKMISMNNSFRDCKSMVNITGLQGDLGTNKQYCNLSQIRYFWDCDGIDNVTLRLWKFSDFCSRHIVGVAGDDLLFHILVYYVPIIVSSWNFRELLPVTEVTSMQKVKVKGQGHRGHNPTLPFPDCNSSLNIRMMMKWCI